MAKSTASMLQRCIPSTGEPLPVVGLGTWQAFDVGRSAAARAPLAAVLGTLAACDGALVDTSPMYGHAEQVLGELMAEGGLRDRFFLATKVWTRGRREGIAQMETSMRRLRTEVVDLMQVHNLVDAEAHLDTLAAWKREGRVRFVGVTHHHASHHGELARVVARQQVDFIQVNYSVAEREAEKRLLPLARGHGVAVLVNRPFVEGALLHRLRARPLPEWAGELGCASWAQLLLKFVVSHPAVTCVIPATANESHLRANLEAGEGPMPDPAMRERIATAAG